MVFLTIKARPAELRRLRRRLRMAASEFNVWVEDIMTSRILPEAVEIAKSYCPVRTGQLRDSIRAETVVPYREWAIRARAVEIRGGREIDYAPFVEFGTRPHVILPRERFCLHFFKKSGEEVFTKRVSHPGTRAYGFLRRAGEWIARNVRLIGRLIVKRLGEVIR